MPTSSRPDPYAGFNFIVEISGIAVGGFAECSGLSNETAVIEYREGTDRALTVRKIPGLTRHAPIVLRRGVASGRQLWDWRRTVIEGRTERRSGAIMLLDAERNEVVRWTFQEGWPSKWHGPHLDARGNEVAIETIEIVHEGLELESSG